MSTSAPKPSHLRLVAYEILRLPFDGWLLIPIAAAAWFIERLLAGTHLLGPWASAWVASGVGAAAYVIIVKPAAEKWLKPARLGPLIARRISRNALRRVFDPSASVVPWVVAVASSLVWLYSIQRTNAIVAGVLSIVGGGLAVSLGRAVANLNVGRSTEIAVARSLIQIGASFLFVFLAAISLWAGLAFSSFFILTLVYWAARSYLRVSAGRVRQETTLNRDFGVKLFAHSAFLRLIGALVEAGVPPRLIWIILRVGKLLRLDSSDDPKERSKAECAVLNLLHRYGELEIVARKYNADFRAPDPRFSDAVKNFQALALMWKGEFREAEDVIRAALVDTPENPYFLYTHARIIWQRGGYAEAIPVIDTALRLYELQKGRKCLPGSAHKAFFLSEQALGEYFAERAAGFKATITEAASTIESVQREEGFLETADLVHNQGNILLIQETAAGSRRVGVFREAAVKFVSCLWRGSHLGSRYRMGLLHAIGTTNYAQAVAYIHWLRDSLRNHGYGKELPVVKRVEVLLPQLERAQREGWVLSERVLLCQSISGSAPNLEIARAQTRTDAEAAVTIRAALFRDLQLGTFPRELFPVLSPR